MKKLCLAGFWIGQYVFGVAAIITIYENISFLWIPLLIVSYYSTIVGGKVLAIGPELQKEANEQVPRFMEVLWKAACVLVILLYSLNTEPVNTAGFHTPFTTAHALILFYMAAALRDVFLVRFYFNRDF